MVGSKLYQGKHSSGCHVCGGYPNSPTRPVGKLYQCAKCGFFTCNKHVQRKMIDIHCPNCGDNKLRTILTQTNKAVKNSGGMPSHLIGKSQNINTASLESDGKANTSENFLQKLFSGTKSPSAASAPSGNADVEMKPAVQRNPSTRSSEKQSNAGNSSESNQKNSAETTLSEHEKRKLELAMRELKRLEQKIMRESRLKSMFKDDEQKDVSQTSAVESSQEKLDVIRGNAIKIDYVFEEQRENQRQRLVDSSYADETVMLGRRHALYGGDEDDQSGIDYKLIYDNLMQLISVVRSENAMEAGLLMPNGLYMPANYFNSSATIEHLFRDAKQNMLNVLAVDMNHLRAAKEIFAFSAHEKPLLASIFYDVKNISNIDIDAVQDALSGMFKNNQAVVSIGPVQIDMHFAPYTLEKQKQLFKAQIEVARLNGLPLLIGHKNADRQLIELLQQHKEVLEGVQCLVVTPEINEELFQICLEQDFYFLVRPEHTFPENEMILKRFFRASLERLIVATGHELFAPEVKRLKGVKNHPDFQDEQLDIIASLFKLPREEMRIRLVENFIRFYDIEKRSYM